MTSYSTYCAGRIPFVDGDLTHEDDEKREEQREQLINCLASGAARALLDCARDDADSEAEVYAEEWHSADEGWELEALDDDARAKVLDVVGRFVDANVPYIVILANYIAWELTPPQTTWSRDMGMALYRVGNLLGYQCSGQGIGLDDYGAAAGDRLSSWVEEHARYALESPYIASSEEPCLLHIDA